MASSIPSIGVEWSPRLNQLPHLAGLRLGCDDYRSLSRQGFVSAEKRGNQKYYKLRFRRDGKQIVRYIGSEQLANAVKEELKLLQSSRRLRKDLRELQRSAKNLLRKAKLTLEPLLKSRGFAFHGRAIRKTRSPST